MAKNIVSKVQKWPNLKISHPLQNGKFGLPELQLIWMWIDLEKACYYSLWQCFLQRESCILRMNELLQTFPPSMWVCCLAFQNAMLRGNNTSSISFFVLSPWKQDWSWFISSSASLVLAWPTFDREHSVLGQCWLNAGRDQLTSVCVRILTAPGT